MTEEKELKSSGIMQDADVSELFVEFNKKYFWEKLKFVEVRWSPRMTLCAGVCVYHRRPGYCSIRLSRPLLALRGQIDLVETLLHEMIHAYLFVTNNNRDRDGHGPEFLKHMYRINKEAGLNISVFHTFQDEVRHYQQHIWQCDGPCQFRSPYFGKVYRAMNRAPGPTDFWWGEHSTNCGGVFAKISEPKGFKPLKKKTVTIAGESNGHKNGDIRSFFKSMSQTPVKYDKSKKQDYKEISNTNIGVTTTESSSASTMESEILVSSDHIVDASENSTEDIENSSDDDSFEDSLNHENNKTVFGLFGAVFGMPYKYLKGCAEDPDPSTVKVRKPDLDNVPTSKRGMLKNLIKVPDQPTLDTFYKKKKMPVVRSKLKRSSPKAHLSSLSQKMKETLKQQSVKSFFARPSSS